ncbi:DNA mismatch repair endonuclease MutL [Geomesophilobacter sediminis]|uniref:DNA mismatch repair protein MutL n=1 Tax=Geomesophilobacter sediminis TaxID=2798584 RepID=A0A8J7S9M1_9BACT|nr:DNA mismatch repair endonuclease MutL [Geomesophilobacter sediminis]MBJ6726966.1 DNA mismatch repair endonuclease MutL [Geomesophilobacter sediminis]
MATRIRILPEQLTNKIAAGEVVERPASVAKELVENALDAGSSEIVVEIENGGRKLIKVTDNGSGMSREDALLALERHATSKIASDEDLFSLSTLGFRGEALPSIASVSRLTIATRPAENLEGTEIYAEGGKIKEVKECGMAGGTVISVRNLFFNTPARLKFMKSPDTESGHVGEFMTRLAISRPDVRFTYRTDGKVVFRALDSDLKERVATLLGRSIAGFLYPVSATEGAAARITGLVAAPECSRSAGNHLYTYINGRFIRDKVVQHAILQAYRNFMERGRYPVVALFIEVPPSEVDVNVHPTKHEVRFREQGRVHDAIQYAVEGVLKATPWLKKDAAAAARTAGFSGRPAPAQPAAQPVLFRNSGQAPVPAAAPVSIAVATSAAALASIPRTLPESAPVLDQAERPALTPDREPAAPGGPAPAAPSSVSAAKVAEVKELLVDYRPRQQPPLRPYLTNPAKERPSAAAPVAVSSAEEVACVGYFSSLSVIGQFNASYIVCQDGTDLVLIDQHAAHERVAFEKLKAEFTDRAVASQGLLFPETMELSFKETATLKEHADELSRLGFHLEEFGGNTWLLKAVPQLLANAEYLRTVRDILEELSSLSRSRTFTDLLEDILAKLACHSVVRGRRPLSQQEIAALFAQMDGTDFSSNCPHGRPVLQRLTLAEVEKMFKRL